MTHPTDASKPVKVRRRTALVVALLLLAVLSSFAATTSLGLAGGGAYLPKPTPMPAALENAISSRVAGEARSVAIDVQAGHTITATYVMTLPRTDPLLRFVQDGTFTASGVSPEEIFGFMGLSGGSPSWGPLSVSVDPKSTVARIIASRTTARSPASSSIQATFFVPLHSTLSLRASGWSISAVSPVTYVSSQTRTSLDVDATASDDFSNELTVTLARSGQPAASAPISSFWSDWGEFGTWLLVSLLAILPWAAFWLLLRFGKGRIAWPPGLTRPFAWNRMGRMIVALAFFMIIQALTWVDQLVIGITPTVIALFHAWYASSVPGGATLLVVVAWTLWMPDDDKPPSPRWLPSIVGSLAAVAAIVAVVEVGIVRPLDPSAFDADEVAFARWVFAGTIVLSALISIGLLIVLRTRNRIWGGVASVGAGLTAAAARVGDSGPQVDEKLVATIIGAALLALMTRYVLRSVVPHGRAWRSNIVIAAVGAAGLVILFPRSFQDVRSAYFDSDLLSYSLQTAAAIALTLLITAGSVSAGRAPRPWLWFSGAIIGSVVFLRWQSLAAGVPLSLLIGIPLFLTVAYRGWSRSITLSSDPESIQQDASRFLAVAGHRRLTREYETALRRKVASADATVDQVRMNGTAATEVRERPPLSSRMRALRERGLGWGGTPNAWKRAWTGAVVGLVVALPLSLPYFVATLDQLSRYDGVQVLTGVVDIVFGFRFPLYGFAFGLLFPMLRGAGGIEKAARMLIVLSITESALILIPFSDTDTMRNTLLLRLVQLVAVFAALGVWFDLNSVRAAGGGLDQLGDLYNVNRLTLWSSGAAITVLTAVLTSVLAPFATALLNDVFPPKAASTTSIQKTTK